MKPINRSEFLKATADGILKKTDHPQKRPFQEFYNKQLPHFSSRSSTGLNPYTGTFGTAELSHLLRRTLFGITLADLDHFKTKTLDDVVAELLTASATPAPPLNNYETQASGVVDSDCNLGETWVNGGFDLVGVITVARLISLKEWWVGLMINQGRNLTEKMTLFWHNHFATEMTIVTEPRYHYKHLALLRSYALGDFKELTRAVTKDPAMLVYLNGNTNNKAAPNENYARELQELFTIGKGPDSHYTEDDVKAAARVLTGWKDNRIAKPVADSYFDATKHDTADKQFSAFYNNKVITGISGDAGKTETDELIDMVVEHPETAKHLCRKLYRWFVYYVIDQQVEDDIITPLAQLLIDSQYDIKPVLAKLFKSEHFFDNLNRGCHIKNPADYIIGYVRQMNIPLQGDVVTQYQNWGNIYNVMALLTMEPGDPPSVAGWPAYYQEPAFHELWINSNTLTTRNDLIANRVGNLIDFLAYTKLFPDARDPDKLLAGIAELFFSNPIEPTDLATMKSELLSKQTADHYWTDAWDDYIADPTNTTKATIVYLRLSTVYKAMSQLAEYHLI